MVKSRSFIATPPGATIKEQLLDRGLSQKEFAVRMGMSEKHISKLINGEVQLTPDVAVRLEMVLGIPAKFWNKLEATYREKLVKANAEYTEAGKTPVSWNFTTMPSENWKNNLGGALLNYAQGTGAWDSVQTAFVDGWAEEYAAANE